MRFSECLRGIAELVVRRLDFLGVGPPVNRGAVVSSVLVNVLCPSGREPGSQGPATCHAEAKAKTMRREELYELTLVVGQRHCSYPGQYAPEVLDAQDEYGQDENPEWLPGRLAHHKATNEFSNVVLIRLEVPKEAIDRALNPAPQAVKAKVVLP